MPPQYAPLSQVTELKGTVTAQGKATTKKITDLTKKLNTAVTKMEGEIASLNALHEHNKERIMYGGNY